MIHCARRVVAWWSLNVATAPSMLFCRCRSSLLQPFTNRMHHSRSRLGNQRVPPPLSHPWALSIHCTLSCRQSQPSSDIFDLTSHLYFASVLCVYFAQPGSPHNENTYSTPSLSAKSLHALFDSLLHQTARHTHVQT